MFSRTDEAWARLDAARGQAVPGTLLVCATRRLAQAWLAEDAQRQAAAGRRSWLRAPIVPYDQWLRALHDEVRRSDPAALPALLDPAQEAALWRAIVDEAGERPLMRAEESARLAAEAWRLSAEWRLQLPFAECNGDVEQFNRWGERFRSRVQRLGLLDPASLPARLQALVAAGKLAPPPQLLLAGFDERSPAQDAWFAALAEAGAQLREVEPARRRAVVTRVQALDRERELRLAAQWARAALQREPASRIGIVTTGFAARRADLQRVFDEVLGPKAYNLSLGEPLADVAAVRTALRLLAARHERQSVDEATALLLSPYWGASAAEQLQRAELDRWLRDDGFLESDLSAQQRVAQRKGLPLVAQRLADLEEIRAAVPARQPAAAWAQAFSRWLVAAGWPGPRAADSAEFQALQAWSELLAQFGALSAVLPALTPAQALGSLREMAARRIFQPRTPAVPVQVLTPPDAAGLQFDRLWVMGLDDEHWPPPARPHPLIPFALQRVAKMPRASGALQAEFASRVLERLRHAADEVVLSHPQQDDELALAPSPLIAQVEAAGAIAAAVPAWPPRWSELAASAQLENVDDFRDEQVHSAAGMRGGTSVFKHQAICAFRGYATHRLRARALQEPGFGPSPIDRGEMVHKAMESLWRRLRSQERLLALDPAERRALVADAIDQGLRHVARRAPQRLGPAMVELERRRLEILVQAGLAMEERRAPFRVVEIEGRALDEEHPEPRSADVAGIQLTLRPDRVDELAGGERVVLDYKTGNVKATPWFDPRPDEPQLLIYGLQQPRLGAVGFAILRAGRTVFRGASGPVEVAEGFDAATGWPDLQKRWQRDLDLLSAEIRSGFAAVTPKTLKACELCDLQALCRIHEAQRAEDDA